VTKQFHFASEYTDAPGGRFRHQGPFSGEDFRKTFLKDALLQNDTVHLDLTGVFLLAPSFIDEAFGIIVEELGYDLVSAKLRVSATDDPMIVDKIAKVMLEHKGKKLKP
jgi:hypothetical protein